MEFWVCFLPEDERVLRRDGIHFCNIRYWSDVLAADLGQAKGKLLIKYDPRDLSRIFVRRPSGRFVEARYRNLSWPSITMGEQKAAVRQLRAQGRREIDETMIFTTTLRQREIEDSARRQTAATRRRREQRPLSPAASHKADSLKGIDSRTAPGVKEGLETCVTTEPPHLTAVAAELLSGSNANRIRPILGERWVHYPRADHVLQILNRLLDHPTTRMPSIAIYGDSGMGKTMIMEKFRREHPPLFDGEAGVERTRVLALQMAGKPGERRLYAQILTALGAPQNPRAGVVDLEQVALRLMRAVDIHVLVLDEVHNILAGTFREQRIVLNTLRYLSNELKISLVCFGVNEAREAISGDVQLARRFEEFPLPRWSADAGFEQLVLAIIRNLPLRQPTVLSARAVRKLLQVSDGISSKVFRMLNDLAIEALKTGAERITDEAIEGWRPVTSHEMAFA